MNKNERLKLLQNIKPEGESKHYNRYLILDGLNLFFRNFSAINKINPDGIHVGGLGGFFRSLGFLINQMQPTEVFIVFDGAGSSASRKNIISEYKSGRNLVRITNWDVFDNLEEEEEAKINQIVRIIQYLKNLPVKVLSLDKVEADDVIAHLSHILPKRPDDKIFIVSSDQDFLQLINDNVVVYRPIEKKYYTPKTVLEKYKVPPHNFLLYKTLTGDNSDRLPGVKGLGKKGIEKKFPILFKKNISLDELFKYCEERYKTNISYARVLQNQERLKNEYRIMDLSNPMMGDNEKEIVQSIVNQQSIPYNFENFAKLYHQDKLEGFIKNLNPWLIDTFKNIIENYNNGGS